jgi:hypothetical protein
MDPTAMARHDAFMLRSSASACLFLCVGTLGCTVAVEPSKYIEGANEASPVWILGGERATSSPSTTAEAFKSKVTTQGQPLGWEPQLALPRAGIWSAHSTDKELIAFSFDEADSYLAFAPWHGVDIGPWVKAGGPMVPRFHRESGVAITDKAIFLIGSEAGPVGQSDAIAISERSGTVYSEFVDASQKLTKGRFRTTAIQCQGHLLAIGGEGNHLGDPVPVEHVDFAKLSANATSVGDFQAGPALAFEGRPHRVSGGAVACANGFVYVIGGKSPSVRETTDIVLAAPFSTDGKLGDWKAQPRLPAPLRDAVVFAAGNRLVVAGGRSSEISPPSTKVLSSEIAADGSLGAWITETRAALPDGLARTTVAGVLR